LILLTVIQTCDPTVVRPIPGEPHGASRKRAERPSHPQKAPYRKHGKQRSESDSKMGQISGSVILDQLALSTAG